MRKIQFNTIKTILPHFLKNAFACNGIIDNVTLLYVDNMLEDKR